MAQIWRRRTIRFAVASLAALVVTPAFTTVGAYQDMTSLLGGPKGAARWQAYFVDASPHFAEGELAKAMEAAKLPAKGEIKGADGRLLTFDPKRQTPSTSDEKRVARTAKGKRVFSEAPAASLPPRGFTAGSIMERQSLLGSRVIGGGDRIRTAFEKVPDTTKEAIAIAANFQLKGPPKIAPDRAAPERRTDDELMLAALTPKKGPEMAALGYAPEPAAGSDRSSSLFDKVLKEQPEAFIPPIGKDDHAWAATPLPASVFSEKEQTCLANAIYFEARGEEERGQAAVAQVILNRVRNPAYPKSICGVVYQNQNWRNRCQFSFACDGIRDRVSDARSFSRARRIAEEVTRGTTWLADVGSSTHYHATYVRPRWASAMERVDKIGKHIFYRTYNGGWN